MPRFVLEYLEGEAEGEATMMRERAAYADWRFLPRTLVDVSERSLKPPSWERPRPCPTSWRPPG